MIKTSLCGMTPGDIYDLISPAGYSNKHALSVSNSIYKRHAADLSMLSGIPSGLKRWLSELTVTGLFRPVEMRISSDKSVKYLFRTDDERQFETVYIPEAKRTTVCVSTQSGCRMSCRYCETGKYGFHGNLTAGEIINQIISLPDVRKVTHVVFMGMGEPMDNIDNVLKACEIITAEPGLAMSPRNVTVSTVGITPGIERFLESSRCNLTFSLYTPFSDERVMAAPVERKYPFRQIIEIMKNYPLQKKRRLSIAYLMIKGLNDSSRHLEELKSILGNTGIRVNLLPYHSAGNDGYMSSSDERMQFFRHNLVMSGISASVRKSRGTDISAACGLLAGELK